MLCKFLLYNSVNQLYVYRASLVAQLLKNPPAMQETLHCIQFLGQEDPVEKE